VSPARTATPARKAPLVLLALLGSLACPNDADPITWTVTEPQARLIGLAEGTYLICLAAEEP
jgi:hypothetical protein